MKHGEGTDEAEAPVGKLPAGDEMGSGLGSAVGASDSAFNT